jgi:hypothetical protein
MPGQQGLVEPPRVFVGVWNLDDNGDVPPKYRIFGPATTLKKPFGVALNPLHKELIVSDMCLNGVVTFHFPELFERQPRSIRVRPAPRLVWTHFGPELVGQTGLDV